MQAETDDIHLIEGNRPGLIGEIVRWHGLYYVRSLGWPVVFEALCAEQLGEIAKHLGKREDVAAFSAWRGDIFLAGVIMDARPSGRRGARLRFFIASDIARGRGIGSQVLARGLAWVDCRGDSAAWLTTVAGLAESAHLYKKHGFQLLEERVDSTWGAEHVEQLWERTRAGFKL